MSLNSYIPKGCFHIHVVYKVHLVQILIFYVTAVSQS